jgi:predicted porin
MQNSYRKNTLALAALLAIGGTVLSTSASAQTAVAVPSSVTVYGRIDLALEANSNGSTNRTAIENFSSRLGFKGDKAFSGDLKGIFQLETGVAPDDTAQSKTLASRNSFVGLSSASMGSLIVGTNDMPLKSMEGTATALWGEGDLQELIIHGKGSKPATNTAGVGAFDNIHTRKTNVLLYTSPKFADVVAKLAYSPDEASVAAAGLVPAYAKNMVGASLYWDNGTFNAGYAYQSLDNAIAPTATTSGYSLTGNKATVGMKMSNWSAGVAMSTIDNGNAKKTNNWIISGAYIMGQTTLKASYGASSESASGASDDLTATAIEADYAFDKDFTLYTYYAVINNSKKAKGSFAAADNFPAVVNAGDTPTALGFGIRYNF